MKRYTRLLFLFIILLASCDLEQLPEATTSKDAVFGSEKGLELYANSFYNILPTANNIHRGDEMSDYGARSQPLDFIREGAFGPRQSSGWDWRDLRNVNYFIENCNYPNIAPDVQRHYIGIARFFRAWFYFDKIKRFGDVPWIGKPMDVDDPKLFSGRDSRTVVMDSILADLDYATTNIRTVTDNTRSLVTKYIAYAFKSRVCLFEGTFRKYHTELGLPGAEALLNEAASAAQVVMDEAGFSINETGGPGKSYRQLFTSKVPVGSEIMLAALCDPTLSVFNDANWWWTSATYGARLSFTRTFINTYLTIDGTPFTDKAGYETMTFPQEVKSRDSRLQQTIRMGDYKRTNAGITEVAPPVFSYTYTGYQPIKWCLDDTYYDGGSRNDNSISIIRYAEVLLNFAEAKAELGIFTDADWTKTIGALRKRAGITSGLTTMPTVVDTYLQANYFPDIADPVILEIRRERSIELVLEGFRFYDLVRWKHGELLEQTWNGFYVPAVDQPLDLNEDGKLDVCFYITPPQNPVAGVTYINVAPTISSGVNPQRLSNTTSGEITWLTNIPRVWEDKHYLYPIPENDRLMNPALGQNPGWDIN
ncbi:RagB/SusD family nutrient uptake outer membrane protein [Ohtaekwangia koreensis]|uniref:Starch-binding associating with outer membrane n=1 Tax=Ohtaekwangia koreensis TaxID=688867 RepID=A0A1T5M4X2_9BACT|nr:RagB/SusD family nutrient uptake outer membrane protein [Ohtaekwangia koreensis]SKC83193.1 Starch-binding associating with outer membrane [Ohtaekwangia koreensis]